MNSFNQTAIANFVTKFLSDNGLENLVDSWNSHENIKAFNFIFDKTANRISEEGKPLIIAERIKRGNDPNKEDDRSDEFASDDKTRYKEEKENKKTNVKSKMCAHSNCTTRPIFNNPDQTIGKFCKAHATEGMVDVKHKRCAHPGCATRPNFNTPDKIVGVFCKAHATEGMVLVKIKRCVHPDCTKQPTFNTPDQTVGKFCKAHATDGMVDVKHTRCAHPGCATRPNFNTPDKIVGVFCAQHKEKGMISIDKKTCQHVKCCADAIYGKSEFHRAQYCHAHTPDHKTYVHVVAARRCDDCEADYDVVVEGGGTQPSHKYCLSHCPVGEYETAMKRLCKYCDLRDDSTLVCVSCKQRSHKKEWAVVQHLRRTVRTPFVYDDYALNPACTKRRPDVRFEMPTYDVIVEVDENQHRSYEETCECARMSEIVGAIGGKSVVFIRYNPDVVRHNGKVRVVPAAERIDLLVEVVKQELVREPNAFSVRLVQLWYDNMSASRYEPQQEMDITHIVAV